MQLENLLCVKIDHTAILTVNRPRVLNTLNRATLEEIRRCLRELADEGKTRALIITGAGDKAFVAGADISLMQELDGAAGRDFGRLGREVMHAVENFPSPVIAAVNGFALGGGCELALACDLRIASEKARFGQPEVNLGVVPGFGGTQRLPRLIGKGAACEMLFTGDIIDARQALSLGLVNRVVPPDDLLPECLRIAGTIGARGPLAVRLCKEAINVGLEMDMERACRYETDLFGACFGSADQREGMRAFLEKRAPQFTGN